MVGAHGSRLVAKRHSFDRPDSPSPIAPVLRCESWRRQREAAAVREHMPEGDSRFAVPGKGRPMRGDRVIERRGPPFDLLPERDGGERLRRGKQEEERVWSHWIALLGIGEPGGKVENEATLPVDGERGAGVESPRA